MSNLKCLTTREVARLCRVSDATVKRWAEADLLKSERTSGGHRRFRAEEVVRFQRAQNLGLKVSHGDESVTKAKVRRLENIGHVGSPLFNALLSGCEEETGNLLVNAYLQHTPLTRIFDDLICPSMRRIGELWFDNELTVTQEHLATHAVLAAVHKLRHTIPVPRLNGKSAICFGVEGDFHELPTMLAQITLENEGWEVINFGANTPIYALKEEIRQTSPELICISATIISDIERLDRDYQQFRECLLKLKIPVILGGRAFDDERVRRRFPAELHAETFAEMAEFVRD